MYRVIYIDDEPDLLHLAKIFLEDSNEFVVDTLTSPQEVLSSETILKYDAIISDYQMPEMNGIEFFKKCPLTFWFYSFYHIYRERT